MGMIAQTSAGGGILDSSLIQLGFAGFCLIILAMLFWTIKQLIEQINKSDKVMAKLTEAINILERSMATQLDLIKVQQEVTTKELRNLNDTLNRKPCIKD